MIFTRTEIEHIDERMENIRKMHANRYPHTEVIYNTHTRGYEVYVDFGAYRSGLKPIATH